MIRFLCLIVFLKASAACTQTVHNNFLVGKTTGALPFLEYGLGEDRLGGAKMTYLDTSIIIKIIDSTIINYKVQLSKNHFAYINKTNLIKDSTISIQPFYLSNSWLVYGDEKYDYVTVMLDERLPYRSIQMINPSRIVVDVYGITSNTNWITQRSSAKEIKNAYYEQSEDDVFRINIELNHSQHWV
ncbi:MAG: AMIN domain-containing protein, partial [Chitinophagaceae bacterium]